jgi:hypothetical protein
VDASESAPGEPSAEARERLLAFADEAANVAIGAGVAGSEAVWAMQIEAREGDAFRGIRAPGGGRYI